MTPEKAEEIARLAHAGQLDKLGEPYIGHMARVASWPRHSDATRVVAWLHDVIEDHGDEWPLWRLMDLGLTAEQADALVAITRQPHESYSAYIERCAANPIANWVKVFDLTDNLSTARLAELPPETADRLRRKYEPALLKLLSARRAQFHAPVA